ANKATFKNINVDYMGGGIKAKNNNGNLHVGGFVGESYNSTFTNISLNNIGDISSSNDDYSYVGGFAGRIGNNATFSNISLNNIGDISSSNNNNSSAGGFAGHVVVRNATLTNISLNNIGNISSSSNNNSSAGGFAGHVVVDKATLTNISLNNIGNISSSSNNSYAGGFAGYIIVDNTTFSNISLNDIGNISSSNDESYDSYAGGFVGRISGYYSYTGNVKFENIYMYFKDDAKITASGGDRNRENKAGKFYGHEDNKNSVTSTFNNIHIYYKDGTLSNATASSKYENEVKNDKEAQNDKINLHTYTDEADGYK
ncbi:hypothetical protein A0068_09245, partial [Campylobacter lari]|nr:hypothetical protein [Campylobacter lari]